MDYVIKKTTELTEEEKRSLLDCFIEVFEHERTLEEMYNQYINTPMGYSLHSLCIDKGQIVAAHTAFPSYYWVGNQKLKFYITGDTMVRKGYRDGVVFLDITMDLNSYMKKEGYSFIFGFPNENTYAVNKKTKQSVEIGRLDTYILPYRIGGIKKGLWWLNPLSKLFCELWLSCCSLMAKANIFEPEIHKDDATYNMPRYKRLDGKYQHVKTDVHEFYYKLKVHEGIRTVFLIDVVGKSEKSFCSAANYIIKHEKENFDLLMFVGYLPASISKIGLIKIPRKYEPKHFYMTGKIYDNNLAPSLLYDINNWDVNLADYDLI